MSSLPDGWRWEVCPAWNCGKPFAFDPTRPTETCGVDCGRVLMWQRRNPELVRRKRYVAALLAQPEIGDKAAVESAAWRAFKLLDD